MWKMVESLSWSYSLSPASCFLQQNKKKMRTSALNVCICVYVLFFFLCILMGNKERVFAAHLKRKRKIISIWVVHEEKLSCRKSLKSTFNMKINCIFHSSRRVEKWREKKRRKEIIIIVKLLRDLDWINLAKWRQKLSSKDLLFPVKLDSLFVKNQIATFHFYFYSVACLKWIQHIVLQLSFRDAAKTLHGKLKKQRWNNIKIDRETEMG